MTMNPMKLHFKRIKYPALLTVMLLAAEVFSQSPDPDFYIFLAFGQSNMEGYPGVEASDKTNVNPRFKLLPAVDWSDGSRTKGTWTTAVPPLCRSSTGLCPVDYFGRTLVDSLPERIKIGVINVAVAGCAIEMFDKAKYQSYISGQAQWMKDIVTGYSGNPYARLVEMAKLAQKDGVIKGFLLHQGESGSSTNQWANEVKTIYNNLITELGLNAQDIPLIAGDLVSSSSMVKALPTTLTNSYVASSQGCAQRGDGLHFNAAGYRLLGKRYGELMIPILKKQIVGVTDKSSKFTGAIFDGLRLKTKSGNSVSFTVARAEYISVNVYTPEGKMVAGITEKKYAAGEHTILLGSAMKSTGAYILKLDAGACSLTRTVIAGTR